MNLIMQNKIIDLGVIGFLTKPITGNDLQSIVKKAKEDLDEEYYRNTSLGLTWSNLLKNHFQL